MTVTQDERRAMADLFDEVGPDAPTLCGEWRTRDLLAHLLVRERRPDAAGGILVPALASRTDKVMAEFAAKPYRESVETFRHGPPMWSVFALPVVGDRINLFEFFVHQEDIRRGGAAWEPRPTDAHREDALWRGLGLAGRMLVRKSPVGVVFQAAGRKDIVARSCTPSVALVGEPSEITLLAYGRPADRTRVVVQGDQANVDAFLASPRGI